MAATISPNMGLTVPTVGQELGPAWANDINADLGVLDQHNHSNGQGVQITPSGLNINSDLSIGSNNLKLINAAEFVNLGSPLAGMSPFLNTIYFSGGNMYVNDGAGNQVKMTSGGTVNATSSGIASGTATAAFSVGVLVVDSNVNTPGNIQAGSILIGNNTAGSDFITLQPPTLSTNYSVTLPPTNSTGSTVYLTYDTSNNIGLGPSTTVARFFASTQVTTASSTIAGGSFTTFSNSPGFTFTPLLSGPYKVYCSIPIEVDGTNGISVTRIFNTSTNATLLYESQGFVENSSTGSQVGSSPYVESIYTLTAGTSYVFDFQGKLINGNNSFSFGNIAPFYMFAQFVG